MVCLIKECFEHTKIITSHDLDMVLGTSRRVIVIKDGLVAADGPAGEILKDQPLLDGCGLECPLERPTGPCINCSPKCQAII